MRKKSTIVVTDSAVAQFIHEQVKRYHNDTPNAEIAKACGYRSANNISMIRHGSSKLPLDKAIRLAHAIGLNPTKLVLMCHGEYLEAANDAFDEVGILPHTDEEAAAVADLLNKMRKKNSK